ncbi:putative aldouronate transport system substrate-binding protein [Paenibacillus sp. UNCCL117]|uniref:extracellular solute-binding protein n=1 Tax=unclassified Paenibacillus TaxID=185978 RepID=UPI00088BE4E6|nr:MULTISPECIES: extracellular solute-binding protein [unclassified Paenibacillus]SDC76885.1 putative aldouronate transport system substrate-binding protein [Paenibacillus sp. cl123]SFW25706.1 putative aldouronate transport system substrate-binding protein [Paenibacillus sp. UNCCL117]
MQINKYLAQVATASVLMTTVLAGCTSSEGGATNPTNSANGQQTDASNAKPTTIKAMTITFGDPPSAENNQAKADLEKRGNVKLDLTFVPSEAYKDKLAVAVSANDYDLLLIDSGKDDKYTNLVKMGAFHDLTDYIKGTKNISQIEEAVWNNTSVQGKIYGIPRPRGLYGGGEASVLIRKDWLDKYNLQVPKTIDELTNALRVFKENDPAGGGKTVPLTIYGVDGVAGPGPFGSVFPMLFAFGVPHTWALNGDKPVRDFQTPEYKEYLEWLRDAWSKGLIDKDAPVLKGQQQSRNKFQAGVAGAFVSNVGDISETSLEKMKQVDPKAEIAVIDVLEGRKGQKGVALIGGYYGIWAIPSSVPKEKVQKIVDFLDFTSAEENVAFSKAGVIGVHASDFKDGLPVQTEDQKKLFDLEKPSAFVLQNRVDPYIYANSKNPKILEAQKASLDVIAKYGVPNPFLSYSSQTATKNPDTYKKLSAVMTQYVLGEATWEAVQKEIDAWTAGTGAVITKELLEQYKADHK